MWMTSCAASALPWWDCAGQDGQIKQSLLPKTGCLSLQEKEEKIFLKCLGCLHYVFLAVDLLGEGKLL